MTTRKLSRAEKAEILRDLAAKGLSSYDPEVQQALGWHRPYEVRHLASEFGIDIPGDAGQVGSQKNSAKARLRANVLALVREHEAADALPTSVRFLYYECVTRRYLKKGGRVRVDGYVSAALTKLREDGDVNWEDIVDETRSVASTYVAPTVADWMRGVVDQARLDPWDGGTVHPFVVTESRSLAGVLRNIANLYAVPIAATNGQAGGFLHTDVGPMMQEIGPSLRVLYLGDLDLAGGQIEANTRAVLEEIVGHPISWRRLAITGEQVTAYGLTPIVKQDNRYNPPRTHEAVETEALSQSVIQSLLRDALDDLLPEPLSVVQDRERDQQERVQVRDVSEEWSA